MIRFLITDSQISQMSWVNKKMRKIWNISYTQGLRFKMREVSVGQCDSDFSFCPRRHQCQWVVRFEFRCYQMPSNSKRNKLKYFDEIKVVVNSDLIEKWILLGAMTIWVVIGRCITVLDLSSRNQTLMIQKRATGFGEVGWVFVFFQWGLGCYA